MLFKDLKVGDKFILDDVNVDGGGAAIMVFTKLAHPVIDVTCNENESDQAATALHEKSG